MLKNPGQAIEITRFIREEQADNRDRTGRSAVMLIGRLWQRDARGGKL
jgi:hypothetical protein